MEPALPPPGHSTRKWAVYSTFDAEGAAMPFAVEQLLAYRALGFETLVVDTSPELTPARAAGWTASSTRWLRRANTGYDFGSYGAGLRLLLDDAGLSIDTLDVLFTNDSCYGPYAPLGDVFARFDAAPRDGRRVFGLTETHEHGHHLQSYWLYFRSDVAHLAADFFALTPKIDSRAEAVRHGELGLARFLVDRSCELVAYRPLPALVEHFASFRSKPLALLELGIRWRLKRPRYTLRGDKACLKSLLGRPYICNPTIAFGTHLHFQALSPLLKRQLVRENPDHDPFVPDVPPADPRDNAVVDRWLRGTARYRRRYGR